MASARRDFGVTPVFKSVDTCGAEFQAFTPYLYSTYEGEDEAPPTARKNDHPWRRAEPDRTGDRVRLLLRAREHGAQRRRLRDHHGQLQPRDGVDRLRHFRSPVLRAADVRGRDGDCRARTAGRRDRAVRRADAAEARGAAGARGRADSGHVARRDRSRGGSRAIQRDGREARAPAARGSTGARPRRGDCGRVEGRLPGADPAFLCAGRARDGSDSRTRRNCAAT